MRWYDLDSGFRRNDDIPNLALMGLTPPLRKTEKGLFFIRGLGVRCSMFDVHLI